MAGGEGEVIEVKSPIWYALLAIWQLFVTLGAVAGLFSLFVTWMQEIDLKTS